MSTSYIILVALEYGLRLILRSSSSSTMAVHRASSVTELSWSLATARVWNALPQLSFDICILDKKSFLGDIADKRFRLLLSHVVCLWRWWIVITSKIISRLPVVSVGRSLSANPNIMDLLFYSKGNTRKFWPKVTHPLLIWASETFDRKLRPKGYK